MLNAEIILRGFFAIGLEEANHTTDTTHSSRKLYFVVFRVSKNVTSESYTP
jgi:hypothetical protein